MNLAILLATAYLNTACPVHAADAPAPMSNEVRELKRRLKQVSLEADLLWKFIGSGPDNPDVATLERAAALLDRRRAAR